LEWFSHQKVLANVLSDISDSQALNKLLVKRTLLHEMINEAARIYPLATSLQNLDWIQQSLVYHDSSVLSVW
jgi:hypothetical protein